MPYTIRLTVYDLGSFYTAGFPAFTAVLSEVPLLTAPLVATSTPQSLTFSFPSAPSPPTSPGTLGTLHVTDPAGPGDFFRSGPIAAWPASPAALNAGTGVSAIAFGSINVDLPVSINLDAGVTAGVGFATGGMFIPFKLTITSLTFSASSTPGAIRASFRGIISYFTLFVPRRDDVTGSVNVTLAPSGDAITPSTFVKVTASNLALSPGFITPLSTVALAILAPAFSGALSGPLTDWINAVVSAQVAAVRMSVPTVAGMPLFSSAATISIRRITVVPSGLVVQAVLAELTASPGPAAPGPSPEPEPGTQAQMLVSVEPPPEEDATKTYMVSVRNAADGSAVQDASVTITTYTPVIGTAVTASATTDAHGLAALEVMLSSRYRPGNDPTGTGQLERTPPRLLVSKQGFEDFLLEL